MRFHKTLTSTLIMPQGKKRDTSPRPKPKRLGEDAITEITYRLTLRDAEDCETTLEDAEIMEEQVCICLAWAVLFDVHSF